MICGVAEKQNGTRTDLGGKTHCNRLNTHSKAQKVYVILIQKTAEAGGVAVGLTVAT